MDSTNEFKIKKKVEKDLETFVDVVNGMSTEEVEKELFRLANYREEVELAKKNDDGLKDAQEAVKIISGPYNDSLKVLKLKSSYLHIMLKERGRADG